MVGVAAGSDTEAEVERPVDRVASSSADRSTSVSVQVDGYQDIEYDRVISITGHSGVRCLHMADGCYRARGLTFVQYEVHSGYVDPKLYDSVCKTCWKSAAPGYAPSSAESDDEVSSSSSSSSAGGSSS